jgi:hypothetical protein
MFKLVKWTVLLGALAVVAFFVPIGGKTLVQRAQAPESTLTALKRGWGEWYSKAEVTRAAAPSPLPAAARGMTNKPTERHSESDRQALDRLIASKAK